MAALAAAAAACLVVVVVVVLVGRDSDSGRDGGAGRGSARYNNDKVCRWKKCIFIRVSCNCTKWRSTSTVN